MRDKLEFMDMVSLMSFALSMANLDENLTQTDKQDILTELNNRTHNVVEEIHKHLEVQDEKLNYIIKLLEVR